MANIDAFGCARQVLVPKVGNDKASKTPGGKQGRAVLYQSSSYPPQIQHGWEWARTCRESVQLVMFWW